MATKTADKKVGDRAYVALSSFKYDPTTGLLVRGQVFAMTGQRNDHLLAGMDYVRAVPKGTVVLECGQCGSLFMDESARERHGRHVHDHWCECGWTPDTNVVDKDNAMNRHIRECEVWRAERQDASQRHLKSALATA